MYSKPYSFLANNTSLVLANPLYFRCRLFRKNFKTNNDNCR